MIEARGCAFVTMKSRYDAERTLRHMRDRRIDGNEIKVKLVICYDDYSFKQPQTTHAWNSTKHLVSYSISKIWLIFCVSISISSSIAIKFGQKNMPVVPFTQTLFLPIAPQFKLNTPPERFNFHFIAYPQCEIAVIAIQLARAFFILDPRFSRGVP